MKVSRKKLAQFLAAETLDKGVSKKISKEVAAYLLAEHRTVEVDSLLRDVGELWANGGFVDVVAVSAHPITDVIRADIKSEVKKVFPNAKQILITAVNDPTVLGGIRLEFANRSDDLSFKTKLSRFKQLAATGKD